MQQYKHHLMKYKCVQVISSEHVHETRYETQGCVGTVSSSGAFPAKQYNFWGWSSQYSFEK